MTQLQKLYRLQQVDSAVRARKARLGDVIRGQKESDALLAARAQAETVTRERDHWRRERRQLEEEIADLEHKTRQASDRLYSGMVKNPKELTDLQHQIEALGRHRAQLEDRLLEAMIALEDAEAGHKEAAAQLAKIAAAWEKDQSSLRQEQDDLAHQTAELLHERSELVKTLGAESLALYEDTARRRGGVAVAGLKNSACLACGVTVSAQKARAAQAGELVYCGSCNRILCPA